MGDSLSTENIDVSKNELVTLEKSANAFKAINPEIVSTFLLNGVSGRNKEIITGLVPDNAIKLNRRGLEIRFKNRLPISHVFIQYEPSFANTFTVEFTDNEGDQREIEAEQVAGHQGLAKAIVGEYVDTLRVKATGLASLVDSPKLLKIEPLIFSVDSMIDLMDFASQQEEIKSSVARVVANAKLHLDSELQKIENEKSALVTAKADLDERVKATDLEIAGKILTAKTEVEAKEMDVKVSQLQLDSLKAEIENTSKIADATQGKSDAIAARLAEVKQSLATTEDLIEQKNLEKTGLIDEISQLKKQVTEWTNKSNLFTADLDGVLGEYSKQMYFYIFLSFVPLLIVIIFTNELYAAAETMLATIKPDMAAANIITYLATRMPFVTIALSIVVGLINWVYKPLMLKVFEIADFRSLLQARVMLVTKLTREISQKLELSEEEEARTLVEVKMKYIEETLAMHFANKLDSKGLEKTLSQNSSLLTAFLEKVLPKFNKD